MKDKMQPMQCEQSYATSSSNSTLMYHLKIKHNITIESASSRPTFSGVSAQPRQDGNLMSMFAKRRKMLRVEEAKVDYSIVNFIFHDIRPFAVVDGDGFTHMVKYLNQDYTIKALNTYHAKAVVAYKRAVIGMKKIMVV